MYTRFILTGLGMATLTIAGLVSAVWYPPQAMCAAVILLCIGTYNVVRENKRSPL